MNDKHLSSDYDYRFDPNKINISIKQFSLYYLIQRLTRNEIDLFTSYQRRKNIWSRIQQSRLIESLLIRIPIPAFYFDSRDHEQWQVIDGLQRVSTFHSFIVAQDFRLEGLEFLPQFNGYFFNDLPVELKRRIEEFTLTVYLVEKGTPEEIKFIIFSRINTAGINLNSQELRFALNQGKATDLLVELSESREFQDATLRSINPKRMMDLELINRFIAFYLHYEEYSGNLDTFMNRCLFEINHSGYFETMKGQRNSYQIRSDFSKSMAYSFQILGQSAFRRMNKNSQDKQRINKALFDCISVQFAWLSESDLSRLISRRSKFLEHYSEMFEDQVFLDSITHSTGSRKSVSTRFETMRALIQNHLE